MAKSEMEKQVKPCQGDKKHHTPLSNLIFQTSFSRADKRLLTALRVQYTRHPKVVRFQGRVRSFRRQFNKLRCQAQAFKVASPKSESVHIMKK